MKRLSQTALEGPRILARSQSPGILCGLSFCAMSRTEGQSKERLNSKQTMIRMSLSPVFDPPSSRSLGSAERQMCRRRRRAEFSPGYVNEGSARVKMLNDVWSTGHDERW
ncbi:hypothetical protein N658DRAFT_214048 [Parathielavia hyrcaniae]|uniref:Uncharacterized protein n=1 Tax=Parathielavia hyrcaniae TaxID=113614 RepID=A0AAN6PVE8_9PEZI|nr:hypothetical protein N658DRAFT_214048 [Parathielavia hyrcaniae]